MDKIFSDQYKNIVIRDRYFLIIDNKENRKLATVNLGSIQISDEKNINLQYFLFKPLNTFWEIKDQSVINQITSKEFFDEKVTERKDIDNEYNKEILGKISEDCLNSENQGSEEIINNPNERCSLELLSINPQEKILINNKKKNIYMIWITPITLLNAAETILLNNPKSINFLRMDSISTILSYANLTNKANTLIFEECNGLLANSFAQRSSIHSNIMSLFYNRVKAKYNNILYLKKKDKYPLTYMKLDHLVNNTSHYYNLFSKLYFNYFENFVLCIKNVQTILKILTMLYRYLKPCGVIIIFSQEINILMEIQKYLYEMKLAIDSKIHQTIVRDFAQSPWNKDHNADINQNTGYVLTAIKIQE